MPVGAAQTGIAAEDVGPAVLAAQDGPLAEYSQSVEGRGTAGAYHRVRQHTVVESDVNAVVVPVKGDRLHIDVGVNQLRAADPDIGAVQKLLRTAGQVAPEIFNAVLVTAGVGDLSRVDGHGLTQIAGIAAQSVLALV